MLGKEIVSVLKTNRAWIFIIIILTIPLVDLFMVSNQESVWQKRANKQEILEIDTQLKEISEKEGTNFVSGWIIHPAKASYLSGSSRGHLTQTILIWLMPLFVLNLFSDRYVLEYQKKYINAILTRTSRRKYFISKISVAFLIPFVVFAISLLVNFIGAQIIFKDGYNFNGLEVLGTNGGWFQYMYQYPNLMYLFYLFITAMAAGICGILTQCIAFVSKKYTITYLVSFFLWMGLIMYKYSVTYLIQPFTEYGLEYFLPSGLILLGITLFVLVVTYVYKVKSDEL